MSDSFKSDEYQNVRLAIGDSHREVRLTLISQFNTFGFKNILHTDNLRDLENAVIKDGLDVIIADEALDPKFPDFIKKIRNQKIGTNPFIIAIATIQDISSQKVRNLTDSGIDDVVMKPLSVAKLIKRLEIIARSRKPFVVTTDYTGPDRRKDSSPRKGSQVIPHVDAPNPLVYLKEKKVDKFNLSLAISDAAQTINEQKMERHAFQITFLVNKILPLYKAGEAETVETDDIERIITVASDISHRLKKTRFKDAASLCTSMVDLAKDIRRSHLNPPAKDLELLPILAQAIQLAFQSNDDGSISVQEIVEKLQGQNILTKNK